jgi:hypothetical protein
MHVVLILAPIVAYFASLFWGISTLLLNLNIEQASRPVRALLLLALASLGITWYFILSFVWKDYQAFASWQDWHANGGSFFFKAYESVVDSAPKWFWSSELLTWICVGTPYVVLQGQRLRLSRNFTLATVLGASDSARSGAALTRFRVSGLPWRD